MTMPGGSNPPSRSRWAPTATSAPLPGTAPWWTLKAAGTAKLHFSGSADNLVILVNGRRYNAKTPLPSAATRSPYSPRITAATRPAATWARSITSPARGSSARSQLTIGGEKVERRAVEDARRRWARGGQLAARNPLVLWERAGAGHSGRPPSYRDLHRQDRRPAASCGRRPRAFPAARCGSTGTTWAVIRRRSRPPGFICRNAGSRRGNILVVFDEEGARSIRSSWRWKGPPAAR